METEAPITGRLRKLFKVGLFLLAIAVPLGLAYVYYTFDEPPPEDGDLLPRRVAIPREENGFFHVKLVPADFRWETSRGAEKPETEGAEEDGETKVEHMVDGEEAWDQDFAAEILEANRGIFERLEKALGAPRFEFEEIRDTEAPLGHWQGLRALSYLQRLKARHELEAGREAEAFSETLKLIRLGHRAEEGKGCIVETLIGATFASRGLEDLTKVGHRTRMGPDELRAFLEELPRYYPSAEALEESLKAEYSLLRRSLADARMWEPADLGSRPPQFSWFSRRFCLKPNATKRLFAEGFRAVREELSAPPWKGETADFDALSGGRVGWFPGRNWVGRSLFQQAMPAIRMSFLRLRVQRDLQISFVRVLIALKCYKLSKGSLPGSLQDLVPAFLPEVPFDPYDGKPLRYSAEKKIVYSVGRDLVDSGGSSEEDEEEAISDSSEPTLRLEGAAN